MMTKTVCMKFIGSLLGCLIMAMAGLSGTAWANLITNGDFETGDLSGWDIQEDVSVVDVGGIYGYAAWLNDPDSEGSAELGQIFYISSDIDAVNISFDYLFTGVDNAAWLDDYASGAFFFLVNGIQVSPVIEAFTFGTISSSSSYFNQIGHYSAYVDLAGLYDADPNALIEFQLIETSAYFWDNTDTALYLDNVDVSPVPEPATLLLLGTGLVGLAGTIRGKMKTRGEEA